MFRDNTLAPGSIASHAQTPVQAHYGLAHHVASATNAPVPRQLNPDPIAQAQREAIAGEALFRQGDYRVAAGHFTEAVRLHPSEGIYHIYLAYALWRGGDIDRADSQFKTALSLQPNNPSLHEILAWFCVEQGRLDTAFMHSSKALALQPDVPSYRITHADVLCARGQVGGVWDLIKPLVEEGSGGVWLARVFAKIAARIGREKEALAAIDRELRAPEISLIDCERLHYAAAGILDGMGEYDLAFEHAKRANQNNHRRFDADAHSRFVSARIGYYTQQQLDSLPRATHGSRRPVFIVGVTRSGTSLVEQILASHPQVHGGGELSFLSERAFAAGASEWTQGEAFPKFWDHLSVRRANQLASGYLDRITALNNTATYVTDKMPENFLFLATAELLLPQCRVIHCVRDPRDTCLSCYFTDFASGKSFSTSLPHLAQYYRDYSRLMAHWKKVLKIPILDVQYEDMIADQEGQTRRILEFLDLPWDENCLKYHLNKRHVATASRDQVRRPIYSSSVGRWKHYEKHIPELLALAET